MPHSAHRFSPLPIIAGVKSDFSATSLSLSFFDKKQPPSHYLFDYQDADASGAIDRAQLFKLIGNQSGTALDDQFVYFPPDILERSGLFDQSSNQFCRMGIAYCVGQSQYWFMLLELPRDVTIPSDADLKLAVISLCHSIDRATLKKIEKQFDTVIDRTHKLEAIAAFSSSFAHSMNNNLAVVVGYAEMLTSEVSPDTQIYSYADAILESGTAATNSVEQLFTYQKIGLLNPQTIEVSDFIYGLKDAFAASIAPNTSLQLKMPVDKLVFSSCLKELRPILVELCRRVSLSASQAKSIIVKADHVIIREEKALSQNHLDPGYYICLSLYAINYEDKDQSARLDAITSDKTLITTLRTIQLLGGRTDFKARKDKSYRFDLYFRETS